LFVFHGRSNKCVPRDKTTNASGDSQSRPYRVERMRFTDEPDASVPCACFAPSGQWLVLMMHDSRILVIPTNIILVRTLYAHEHVHVGVFSRRH
jgi:hypothetical protein